MTDYESNEVAMARYGLIKHFDRHRCVSPESAAEDISALVEAVRKDERARVYEEEGWRDD